MSKNPLFRNGEENEKAIRNPHADPDHQRLCIFTTSSQNPIFYITTKS